MGSLQADELKSHIHNMTMFQDNGAGGSPFNPIHGASTMNSMLKNVNATGGNETRPKNVYVNYIIKY